MAEREDDEWYGSTFRQDGTVDDKNRRWRRCAKFIERVKGLVKEGRMPAEDNEELESITYRAMQAWRRAERCLVVFQRWGKEQFDLCKNAANYDLLEAYAEHMVEGERLSFRKDISVINEYYERHPEECVAFDADARDRLATTSNRINGRTERISKAKPLLDAKGWDDRLRDIALVAVNLGLRSVDALAVRSNNVQVEGGRDGEVRILIRSNGKSEDKADRTVSLRCGCAEFQSFMQEKTTMRNCCICGVRKTAAGETLAQRIAGIFPIRERELRDAMGYGGGTMHSARRTAMIGLTIATQECGLYVHTPSICRALAWGEEAEMKQYTHYAREYARLPVMFPSSLFATTRSVKGYVGAKRLQYIETYEVEVPRQTKKGIMTSKQVRQRILGDVPWAETAKKLADRTSYPLGGTTALQGVLTAGEKGPSLVRPGAPPVNGFFANGLRGGIQRAASGRPAAGGDLGLLDSIIAENASSAASSSAQAGKAAPAAGAPAGGVKRRPGRPKKGEENPDGPKRRRKEK